MLLSLQDAAVSAASEEPAPAQEAAAADDFVADLGINFGFNLAAIMSEMTGMDEELAPEEASDGSETEEELTGDVAVRPSDPLHQKISNGRA